MLRTRRSAWKYAAVSAITALVASLGGLAIAPAAHADPVTSRLDGPLYLTPGTLDNGVTWNRNAGSPWECTTRTFSFNRQVDVVFGISGLNSSESGGEGVIVPPEAQVVAISPVHSWNPSTRRVARTNNDSSATSTFKIDGVTSFSLQGSGACNWNREVAFIDVTYNSVPPAVTVTGPADGAEYEQGATVPAAFTCADSDLVSCSAVDGNGNPVNPGDPVDTSTPGTHTITVTGTDADGNVITKTSTYTVKPKPVVPPTVDVAGPAEGGTYFEGEDVPASYTCADADGAVASCTGTVPNGSKIDTSTPGNKTFVVTATDDQGNVTTKTVTYKVAKVNGICKGQALGLPLGITLGTANAKETPCVNDTDTELNLYVPITGSGPANALASTIRAQALASHSITGPGLAAADSTVASATVNVPSLALNLAVTAVKTDAKSKLSSCSSPATLTGSSTLGSLKLNGLPIVVGTQPLSVPLIVGGLYINQKVVSGNTLTQRAVFLDLPGALLDVVIAESKAGATCGA